MSSPQPSTDPAPTDPTAAVEPDADATEAGLPAERSVRLAKLERLREAGAEPYPYRFDRTHTTGQIRASHGALEAGAETEDTVAVAGRLMLIRRQGKLIFATMRDREGELQLFVSKAVVGDEQFGLIDALDLGDWVGAVGTVMVTKRGELSVKVQELTLLSKALRPLPDKWKGLTDVDTRFRQRYVDLIVNHDARRTFEVRHAVVASIRRSLSERGFVEVETPMLQLEAGGAHARPFVTHHNTLGLDMFLRIAIELHLKRLIVAGLERVFEIGRIFRNEGVSTRHNPEFTMLEAYQAFGDYTEMMELTEHLIVQAARDALGTTVVTIDGRDVDLGTGFKRASMIELIREHGGVDAHPSMPVEQLRKLCDEAAVPYEPWFGPGKLVAELFEGVAERHLLEPTFVTDHPREVSPLARTHRDDPHLVERFELIVAGRELCNAYSELNDPIDQRARFEAEEAAKAAGDLEAGTIDEDYLRALEHGMPPTGGLGIGIDRLVMLLAGVSNIKEVILFPTLRPEAR